jgi:hypothetical protein
MPRHIQRPKNLTDTELKAWLETQYDLNENGCWVWKQAKNPIGYGIVSWKRKTMLIHRLYWLLFGRTIPDGLELCHGQGCSKACYNPNHLRTDTRETNMIDKHRDGTMKCSLTPEQVLEIRSKPLGMKHEDISKEYGVCRETISMIRRGATWKWL